ncbi:MAG: HIT family protein [Ornithinimicrobium sp.]
MSKQCLFCDIASGAGSSAIVHRGSDAVAFLDIRPLFKGHVLVIPRRHVVTLVDLPSELMGPVMGLAQRVSAAMVNVLDAQGSFVAMNNTVSQSVPHLHIHVVPRTKGDGLRGFFWPRQRYAEGEMELYAARLAEAVSQGFGA